MKFTKAHEGKVIYALPTGNSARYNPDKITTFTVVKVKSKYVALINEFGREDNYCMESGATQDQINRGYSGNSGYKFFENEKSIKDYYTKLKIVSRMDSLFNYNHSLKRLTLTQVIHLADTLEDLGLLEKEGG